MCAGAVIKHNLYTTTINLFLPESYFLSPISRSLSFKYSPAEIGS